MLGGGEPLACHRESSTGPPERIVTAASMTERLVLHPAAALIKRSVGELDDMEGVSDLGGAGQHRAEHRPIRGRQIKRCPLDPGAPRRIAISEPATRPSTVAARHDIEELTAAQDLDFRLELTDPPTRLAQFA